MGLEILNINLDYYLCKSKNRSQVCILNIKSNQHEVK